MSPEAWGFLGVAVAQAAAVIVAGITVTGRIREAKETAQQAVDQTASTGNGFARRVESALSEIRQDVRAIRQEAADDRHALAQHLIHHELRRDV